jgi:glycosyltransferase involved in cell wall biosynthesis
VLSARTEHEPFSIVIPTHNRAEKLFRLLQSIEVHMTTELSEVVVVDDSDRPPDLAARFPALPIRHIVLESRVFISQAKNIGWREASGRHVFFIDDDNVVTPSTFGVPLDLIASTPTMGAVVPAVLYKDRPDIVWVYATPLAQGRWGHALIGRNLERNASLENRIFDTDALPNAALVRRRALVDINGFSERLVVNSSADAAMRLKQRGWTVCSHTGAFILHDVEPPGRVGYWAQHGAADPGRVYHEIRDWFSLMNSLHGNEGFFLIRATAHAIGFMVPNGLAFLLRGGSQGRQSLKQLIRGYLSSLRVRSHE